MMRSLISPSRRSITSSCNRLRGAVTLLPSTHHPNAFTWQRHNPNLHITPQRIRLFSNSSSEDKQSDQLGIKTAIVTAASVPNESDRFDKPKPLLELGGQSLLSHVLWTISQSGMSRAVVITGDQEQDILECVQRDKENGSFGDLEIEFVHLGRRWRSGHVKSLLKVQEMLPPEHDIFTSGFLLCPCDYILDPGMIRELAQQDLVSDEACMLVETDLVGMVGLPATVVQVAMRPLHHADRVYAVGTKLPTYGGIDAGALACSPEILTTMQELESKMGHLSIADVLGELAEDGALRLTKTNGRTWFSVQTPEQLHFASDSLQEVGHRCTLAEGKEVVLVGMPTTIQEGSGGEWTAFDVNKWRSAVFTTKSYFAQLYRDTATFIKHAIDEAGGKANVMVVEVGCGTGEALKPLFNECKYTVGVDFNPLFVQFTQSLVTGRHQHSVRVLEGDAQELGALLGREVEEEWLQATNKVVICVGNTIGIIPKDIRAAVVEEMCQVAGSGGVVIIAFWNGNWFGDAVQNFYHKNPQLCGPFTGECIDLDTRTLTTPSGYCTHWTTPEEAREWIGGELGYDILKLEEKGKGVLVAFRKTQSAR